MKTAFALVALVTAPLLAPASAVPVSARSDARAVRFEQAVASAPAGDPTRYFVANSAVSFAALGVAGALVTTAEMALRRRRQRDDLATSARDEWRDEVMTALAYDLEVFSRQWRRAA